MHVTKKQKTDKAAYMKAYRLTHKVVTVISTHLCECGTCGKFTTVADRTSSRLGTVKGQPRRFRQGHGGLGSLFSWETRLNAARKKTGREPIVSPIIPETIVHFEARRSPSVWIAHPPNRKVHAHAKAVWEYFRGPVPEGFRVHHKTGDSTLLENDAPDKLMLLTHEWNFSFMPQLAKGFGIPEAEVTQAYLTAEHLPYEQRFPEVCGILLQAAQLEKGTDART